MHHCICLSKMLGKKQISILSFAQRGKPPKKARLGPENVNTLEEEMVKEEETVHVEEEETVQVEEEETVQVEEEEIVQVEEEEETVEDMVEETVEETVRWGRPARLKGLCHFSARLRCKQQIKLL